MRKTIDVRIGDCREVLKTLPEKSADLAILDPPYYKTVSAKWDNQWKTFDDYLNWLEDICLEVKRVLKANGSLFLFGDDEKIAYIQVRLDKHFTFLNHLIWRKSNACSIHGAEYASKFVCVTERILYYGKHDSAKEYLITERKKSGMSSADINEILVGRRIAHLTGGHYFWNSQWRMPTKEMYEKLQKNTDYFKKPYEELIRTYNYTFGQYEILDFPIISKNENTFHPTTKPVDLIKRLIGCASKEGDLILDPFSGSGTVGIGCNELNRNAILIELNPEYKQLIEDRINSKPKSKPQKRKVSHVDKLILQQNLTQYFT